MKPALLPENVNTMAPSLRESTDMDREFDKFNQVDYAESFSRQIKDIHQLCRNVLKAELRHGDKIIDLGGGPGIGARMINQLGIEASCINIDPSDGIDDLPQLTRVEYIPKKITFKNAFSEKFPWKADRLLLMSSSHEIALSYGKKANKNKILFVNNLKRFVKKFLKKEGSVIISFPGYLPGSDPEQIRKQREFNDRFLGHSHSYDEYFYLDDFLDFFPGGPRKITCLPMVLAGQESHESILTATVAVFSQNS